MIIIEGPDGSGKTTLATKLATGLTKRVLHAGGPPKTREDIYDRIYGQFLQFGEILDRATIVSEPVYGPLLRKKIQIKPESWKRWVQIYSDRGFILIYCRPSINLLLRHTSQETAVLREGKSYKSEAQVERVKKDIVKIVCAYDDVIKKIRSSGMEVLTYVRN